MRKGSVFGSPGVWHVLFQHQMQKESGKAKGAIQAADVAEVILQRSRGFEEGKVSQEDSYLQR